MEYISFSSHSKGFYHVRAGTDCEDYSASYVDPQGRFAIGVICDGHSDKNCFRSGIGARLGCDAMLETGRRFFDLYFDDGSIEFSQLSNPETIKRLKYSIKCCWDDKVAQDIARTPLTEEEMSPLTERVYNYYKSGKGLNNIYGATFLAVAICDNFFIAFHIGDGEILCINKNGEYYDPLPLDEKSDSGSPASLCDSDLFSRDTAFRCIITQELPIAAVVSSDGIPDCMDSLQYKERIYSLLTRLKEKDVDGTWNSDQSEFLNSYTAYWAREGVGVEDDCSIAGFYNFKEYIPMVTIPYDEAMGMILSVVQERNSMVSDYEKRKKQLSSDILQQNRIVDSVQSDIRRYPTELKRLEDMLSILHNMETNEKEKLTYYDKKIEMLEEYIKRVNGRLPSFDLSVMTEIESSILKKCSVSTIKSSSAELQKQLRELLNERKNTIIDFEEKKQGIILEIDSLFRNQAASKTNREAVYSIWCEIRSLQLQLAETEESESRVVQSYEVKIKQLVAQLKQEGIVPKIPTITIQAIDPKYLPASEEDWAVFKSEMHQDDSENGNYDEVGSDGDDSISIVENTATIDSCDSSTNDNSSSLELTISSDSEEGTQPYNDEDNNVPNKHSVDADLADSTEQATDTQTPDSLISDSDTSGNEPTNSSEHNTECMSEYDASDTGSNIVSDSNESGSSDCDEGDLPEEDSSSSKEEEIVIQAESPDSQEKKKGIVGKVVGILFKGNN